MSCRALLRTFSLTLLLMAMLCDGSWANSVSLNEYRVSIQEALSRVEPGKGMLSSDESAFFENCFPPRFAVNTRSGEPVQVDNGPVLALVKQAQESDQGREALISHLKALRSQLSFVEIPNPLSEERWSESLAQLNEVFSAREFQGLEEAAVPAWLVFLMDLLKKIGEWLAGHGGLAKGYGEWVEYAFYGVVVAGLLLLIFLILRSFGPVGWRFKDRKVTSGQERKVKGLNWQSLREESRDKSEKGEYREAIRLFFISVLMEGHERGWWTYRREATNREHLIGVEASAERREALRKMIQVYENAWYGHESPSREAFMQCADWLRRIEAG